MKWRRGKLGVKSQELSWAVVVHLGGRGRQASLVCRAISRIGSKVILRNLVWKNQKEKVKNYLVFTSSNSRLVPSCEAGL